MSMSFRGFLAVVFIVGLALALGQPGTAAIPPQPTYGTADVDGNIGEWDLTNDFFANMYRAGDPTKKLESKAYLRYDCDTHTMYVLVLTEEGVPALAAGWESSAWAAIDTISNKVYTGNSGDDGIPPDFEWVGLSGDGLTADGYEASFALDPGTYTLIVHVEVFDDADSQTSATVGFPKDGVALEIVCDEVQDHPDIILEKYVSVDGGVTYFPADFDPGPTVLVGDPVYFKFVVTNSGNVTLTNLTLTDNVYDLSGCVLPASLAPGDSFQCIIGPFPAVHGQQMDTGTATGDSGVTTVTHTDDANYLGVSPDIDVTKYVSVDDGVTWEDANSPTGPNVLVGQGVLFKFIVTNSGDVPLTNITLTDNVYDLSGCTLTDPLGPGDSFECVIGPFPALLGQQTDTATATGDFEEDTFSDTNPANYFGEDASISVVKSVGTSAGGPWYDANSSPGLEIPLGDSVFFQFVITNTGTVPLTGVTLTDSVYNAGSTPPFVPTPPIPDPLGPGDTYTYVYGPVTPTPGQHINVATVTGTSPGGSEASETDPANYFVKLSFLYQAYPGDSDGNNEESHGYAGSGDDTISSVPGVFVIVPQGEGDPAWANYVQAFQDQVDYTLKNVTLCKEHPDIIQCADVFPSGTICQQGTPNIRLTWPLMYEVPGTTWTLTILYGTSVPYDPDGPGPDPGGYVHTEVWTWQVDATVQSMKDLLELFHEVPFGLDEVPLVSDEVLYPILQAKLDAIQDALDAEPSDTLTAGLILGDFEMEVMDACIGTSPARPRPTGPGTGIAATIENPACCKLMADSEYVGFQLGILQPAK